MATEPYAMTLSVLDSIAAATKQARHDKGLSLRKAADQIGIPWTTLYNLETSDHSPRVDVVKAVLAWLGS